MIGYGQIKNRLTSIDKKDFGAYQSLIGMYKHENFKLIIKQIPKDPYAPPHTGIYLIQVPSASIHIPDGLNDHKFRKTAFCDFFARRFFQSSSEISKGRRGTGYSGIITIDEPGQSILNRSSVVYYGDYIELRMFIGLPAGGRNIKSRIRPVGNVSESQDGGEGHSTRNT